MKRKNQTRRTLLMSCISLLLCVSMLVGSTFAWFTDVASTGTNKIQAGTLQIELWEKDAQGQEHDISTSQLSVFDYENWEPGYRDYTDLIVKNVGTLALKYELHFSQVLTTGTADIAEVLEVYIGGNLQGNLRELANQDFVLATSNTLTTAEVGTAGVLAAGEKVYLPRIEVVMQKGAGNAYQGCGVTFDVVLRAIQASYEPDGYNDPSYDENANGSPDHPEFDYSSVNTNGAAQAGSALTSTAADGKTKFTVPADTVTAGTDVTFSMAPSSTPLAGGVSYTGADEAASYFDIQVKETVTGDPVPSYVQITLDAKPAALDAVNHKTNAVEASASALDVNSGDPTPNEIKDLYSYDPATGVVTLWLESYSPVSVMYKAGVSMNGVKYDTLPAAVAASKGGETITLLGDVANGTGVVINKPLTIDFAGHTYTVGSTPLAGSGTSYATQCFQVLSQAGNVTFKNGTIIANTSKAYMMIQNYANLTLDGMNLNGKAGTNNLMYILSNNSGNIAVKNSSLIGGSVNALDVMHWHNEYAAPVVTVDNSTIEGKVDVYCDPATADCATPAQLIVNSGIFSQDLSAYVPAGMKCELNAETGKYTVAIANFYKDANGIWQIRNPQGMQEFKAACEGNQNNGFQGQTVELNCDIDMFGQYWEPICGDDINSYPSYAFKGTFDGKGHSISNLDVYGKIDNNACSGLFGSISSGAVVKNVILKDSTIRGTHWTGGIVGYISDGNSGSVQNCQVINCTITSDYIELADGYDNGDKAGGIVGYAAAGSFIGNTVSNSTINGYRDLGGIVGYAQNSSVVISGNTVDGLTINVNNQHNYKNYTSLEEHDANEIVGENYGTVSENTATNVTIVEAE